MTVDQARKLGIRTGHRVALHRRPPDWELTDPPPELSYPEGEESVDILIAFYRAAVELDGELASPSKRIFPHGALWIAWPRRAGGHHSDITDIVIREAALPLGIVDNKVAAIDDDWSGLRFVWRLSRRG